MATNELGDVVMTTSELITKLQETDPNGLKLVYVTTAKSSNERDAVIDRVAADERSIFLGIIY